eukprot:Rhum_TRINITY_DN14805_c32_g1::Rhum_TRINITY_DN14805_c32_g1_i1::g.121554::m.121554
MTETDGLLSTGRIKKERGAAQPAIDYGTSVAVNATFGDMKSNRSSGEIVTSAGGSRKYFGSSREPTGSATGSDLKEPTASKAQKSKVASQARALMGANASVVRPVRRRRGVGTGFAAVDESSGKGTVRAVSTCSEFDLDAIAAHYTDRGLEVIRKEAIVWLKVNVPSYKFDSEPKDCAEREEKDDDKSGGWLAGGAVVDADADMFEREYTMQDSDEEEEDEDKNFRVRPGRQYEYNIFFHLYGVIVWWTEFPPQIDREIGGFPLMREVARMKDLFEIDSLEKVELDTCRWTVGVEDYEDASSSRRRQKDKGPTCYIDQDVFFLSEKDPEFMLAYGCGLAQSAKVSEFEDKIEDVVEETKEYPICMAKTGKSELTRTEVAKIRGSLFLHRMYVNLHTDVLETPEFFWNRTDLEPLYLQARRYMEISHRTEVLNKRLEIVHDLFAAFHEELNTTHGNYLEWIIIWLIVAEIVLGAVTAYLSMANEDDL